MLERVDPDFIAVYKLYVASTDDHMIDTRRLIRYTRNFIRAHKRKTHRLKGGKFKQKNSKAPYSQSKASNASSHSSPSSPSTVPALKETLRLLNLCTTEDMGTTSIHDTIRLPIVKEYDRGDRKCK